MRVKRSAGVRQGKKRKKQGPLYRPSLRLARVRSMLERKHGATLFEMAEHLDVSERTAIRYMNALTEAGAILDSELDDDGRKRWRIDPGRRREQLLLSKLQMSALFLSRSSFDFLDGTDFKVEIDDLFHSLEAMFGKDNVTAKRLASKLLAAAESSISYKREESSDSVKDIVSALLYDQKLLVTYDRVVDGKEAFRVHPYTLVLYKRGLYLVGWSEYHRALRTFPIDSFGSVERLLHESFPYPENYDPKSVIDGAFGLVAGAPIRVRIFFTKKVARLVERRIWHSTQKIKKVAGGIELEMELRGTLELPSWILSWGDQARLLEPKSLADDIAAEHRRAAELYA